MANIGIRPLTFATRRLTPFACTLFDLMDALTVAGQVSSPVALSEQKPFRRKFESVYEGLQNGEMDIGEILSLLPDCVPEDSETIAGYQVYAVDATPNEHEEGETLPDRSGLKSNQSEPLRYGHKYSWVVRLIHFGTSWAAPVDVERIRTESTDTKLAAVQIQELDLRDPQAKVIVADSRYQDHQFLSIFEPFQRTFALIRLRSNGVLFEEPKRKPKGRSRCSPQTWSVFQIEWRSSCCGSRRNLFTRRADRTSASLAEITLQETGCFRRHTGSDRISQSRWRAAL